MVFVCATVDFFFVSKLDVPRLMKHIMPLIDINTANFFKIFINIAYDLPEAAVFFSNERELFDAKFFVHPVYPIFLK